METAKELQQGRMEVTVLEIQNAPPKPMLAISAGSVRRQARPEVGRPFIIPRSGKGEVQVCLFQQLGSLSLPPECQLNDDIVLPTKSEGVSSSVKLRLRRVGASVASAAPPPPARSPQEAVAQCKEYMEHHKLQQRIQVLIQDVLKEQPENPFRFMVEQLKKSLPNADRFACPLLRADTEMLEKLATPRTLPESATSPAPKQAPDQASDPAPEQAPDKVAMPQTLPESATSLAPKQAPDQAPEPATEQAPDKVAMPQTLPESATSLASNQASKQAHFDTSQKATQNLAMPQTLLESSTSPALEKAPDQALVRINFHADEKVVDRTCYDMYEPKTKDQQEARAVVRLALHGEACMSLARECRRDLVRHQKAASMAARCIEQTTKKLEREASHGIDSNELARVTITMNLRACAVLLSPQYKRAVTRSCIKLVLQNASARLGPSPALDQQCLPMPIVNLETQTNWAGWCS